MRLLRRQVKIGNLVIGGEHPVLVQSMLNAPAGDVEASVRQAVELEKAGCQIVRVAVPTLEDVRLIPAIKNAVKMPLVADIHFDHRIALAAVEAGVDKIRLNPGNIGGKDHVAAVAAACKEKGVPIRIGVNAGSLEKDLLEKYGRPTPHALCESALRHIGLLEAEGFYDIVVSIKSSHVPTMIEAYRLLATQCEYPLHLGVTEAGTYRMGLVKSALGIGALLLEGIGDTLRVSLTGDPVKEIQAGFDILRAAGHEVPGPVIISCPTCGRTGIDVEGIADEVERRLAHYPKKITVAVMGCVVNGPGEAREADIGIAGGRDSAVLFVKGKQVRTLRGDVIGQLMDEIHKLE